MFLHYIVISTIICTISCLCILSYKKRQLLLNWSWICAKAKATGGIRFRTRHVYEAPTQKIVTDVTYLQHKGKWYYFACYLDLLNNEILDWELSDTFDNFLVMKSAKRILEKTKSTASPILFHGDQGVQYSSAGYCNLLKSYNIIQKLCSSSA